MADPLTLESLQGFKEFQDSDIQTKQGWVNNFAGQMFREGRLDEALAAQDYLSQIQIEDSLAQPAAQVMQDTIQSLFRDRGYGDETKIEDIIGQERYSQIQDQHTKAYAAIRGDAVINEVSPGEYVYTRKNPFGTGTLLETEGAQRFLEDEEASPDAIKRITKEEEIPTIKKSDFFNELISEVTPNWDVTTTGPSGIETPTMGFNSVEELMTDKRFSALDTGDQRTLLRSLGRGAINTQNQNEWLKSSKMLEAMDKEYEANYWAGKYLGGEAWYDFFSNSVYRGVTKWARNQDRRVMEREFATMDELQGKLTPEQRDTANNLATEIQQLAVEDRPLEDYQALLKGTSLEGQESVVRAFSWHEERYIKNREDYIHRSKVISMIPETEGMQQFQANQQKLKDSGAGWQAQAIVAAKDIVTNPLDVVFASTLESIVSQPLATVGTAALFAIPGGQGPAAAIATRLIQGTGTAIIAGAVESSYTYTDELEKARRLPDGSERPMEDILTDPVTMTQINDAALLRGAAIGTVEGVTGWLLPGSMNQLDRFFVSRGARKRDILAFNMVQAGTQAVQEGAGESAAMVASSQEFNIGEVMLEAAAGIGGPDTFAMWRAPEQMKAAREQRGVDAATQEILAQADAVAAEQAILSPDALARESARPGIYAQGIVPQISIGEADANGFSDIEVYYDAPAIDGDTAPIATEVQGLGEVSPPASVTQEEAVPEETGQISTTPPRVEDSVVREQEALPIDSPTQVNEGQTVSYIQDDGSVRSGTVSFGQQGEFLIDRTKASFRPGKFFQGTIKPKETNFEPGDTIFTGLDFWQYIGDDKFIAGRQNNDGDIQFDPSEVSTIPDTITKDPRIKVYTKPDVDAAISAYNQREDRSQKFGTFIQDTPEKGQKGAQEALEVQQAPTAPESTPSVPTVKEQVATPIATPVIGTNKVTMFKLRAHKDVNRLLEKAVNRFNDWMNRTKVLDRKPDSIRYAKDGKVQELFRQQAPETFDDTVNQLTKEDKEFRDAVEPTKWTEVSHYRELERHLKNRIERTKLSKNKSKRNLGILKDAQVSSILQALFIQDRAIATYAGTKFGLNQANGSLITIEDVAELRYGNVKDWTNPNRFGSVAGSYNATARLVELGGNASVVEVFHELYHDFLLNIAPLIMSNEQYVRLQKFIDSRLAQTKFRDFIKKNYRNSNGEKFTDADFVFNLPDGSISIPAQEAFTNMMVRWHFDGRRVTGLKLEDQGVLDVVTNYFQQVFQDLGRTPIATTTDDAHDLLSNFWITPPVARREQFEPVVRQQRINDEVLEEDLSLSDLSAGIGGRVDNVSVPEEQRLSAPPQIMGDKLADTFRPDAQPRTGVPFLSGDRPLVIESNQVFEIVDTPAGLLKVPRPTEDHPWDGQTELPPVEDTGVPNGTQEVSDRELPTVAQSEASLRPIVRTQLPDSVILTDTEAGMVISDRAQESQSTKIWEPEASGVSGASFEDVLNSYRTEFRSLWPGDALNDAQVDMLLFGTGAQALWERVKDQDLTALDSWFVENEQTLADLEDAVRANDTIAGIVDNLEGGKEGLEEAAFRIVRTMERAMRGETRVARAVMQTVFREVEARGVDMATFERAVRQEIGKTYGSDAREMIEAFFGATDQPEGLRLYSIEDDSNYQMGRMSKRLLGNQYVISQTLKQIAKEENKFLSIPTEVITSTVEARMLSKQFVLDALRDIYKLRRMGPDQRTRAFNLPEQYQGGGNAALIYYLLAMQSRLDQALRAQDNGQDVDLDRNTLEMFMGDVTRAVAIEQREAGRAVNINKRLLTYAPDAIIERLESDLIRNNAAFKSYVRRANQLKKRTVRLQLTDEQFTTIAKEEGFPDFLIKPLRLFAKDPKGKIKDFEEIAAAAWAKDSTLNGMVSPESRANIKRLSMAAQSATSPFMRDFYAQIAHLAIESERGIGLIDSANGIFYNNILFAASTALVNIVGTAIRIPLDFLAYYIGLTTMEVSQGKFAAPVKNLQALLKGIELGLRSIPEGATETTAIALSGQRGTSVEAFAKAQGAIANTQVNLFGRPGTRFRDRGKFDTAVRRFMAIVLTDLGRRNATAFDAFYKVFSENAILGAELYREAWDTHLAEKPKGVSRSQFISSYIDQKLNVHNLEYYQALATDELARSGDLIFENSTTILPKAAELSVLRNVIAFNLRREAREQAISPDALETAKRMSYSASYSNEVRGLAKGLANFLNTFATLGPVSRMMASGRTRETLGVRWRLSAGGAINPAASPFSGNIARMAEEFMNWVGPGPIAQLGTNYFYNKKGRTETFWENTPDTYTKTEVASNFVKSALGMGTTMVILGFFNGDSDDDEEKNRGISGFRSRTVLGRNGKDFFIPAYSFWWRLPDGKINYLSYKDHPQFVATIGTAATYNERRLQDPDAPWPMMFYRVWNAALAGLSESGVYDGVLDLASFIEQSQEENEMPAIKLEKGLKTNLAKFARSYANPLNRFQKETLAYSLIPGRGTAEAKPSSEFFPMLYQNTLLEGWLSEEDSKKLDFYINPDGSLKSPNVLKRLGGITVNGVDIGDVIKPPTPALTWMVQEGYAINKTDYQRSQISSLFSKEKMKQSAEAEFQKMNNGMFFVEHASEIEKRAGDIYWPWLETYRNDAKRQQELEQFVGSATNDLRKKQNSPQYKTFRELQQADINQIVTQARNIASLTVAADWYTDNQRVQGWARTIASAKTKQGYKLDKREANPQLEETR